MSDHATKVNEHPTPTPAAGGASHQAAATSSQPPAGELFSDPGARVVWGAVQALDIGQQHMLLGRLREMLGTHAGSSVVDERPAKPCRTILIGSIFTTSTPASASEQLDGLSPAWQPSACKRCRSVDTDPQ